MAADKNGGFDIFHLLNLPLMRQTSSWANAADMA